MTNPTDINQASELELQLRMIIANARNGGPEEPKYTYVQQIIDLISTEKLKLLNELDKSMPTAEQLTTKYGYHMPEKQYGYKLGLHDIREVIEAERKKLKESSND